MTEHLSTQDIIITSVGTLCAGIVVFLVLVTIIFLPAWIMKRRGYREAEISERSLVDYLRGVVDGLNSSRPGV